MGVLFRLQEPINVTEMNTNCGNVEGLSEEIATLVRERQELRQNAADPSLLERNRRRITELQWALSRALIQRHLPEPQAA